MSEAPFVVGQQVRTTYPFTRAMAERGLLDAQGRDRVRMRELTVARLEEDPACATGWRVYTEPLPPCEVCGKWGCIHGAPPSLEHGLDAGWFDALLVESPSRCPEEAQALRSLVVPLENGSRMEVCRGDGVTLLRYTPLDQANRPTNCWLDLNAMRRLILALASELRRREGVEGHFGMLAAHQASAAIAGRLDVEAHL